MSAATAAAPTPVPAASSLPLTPRVLTQIEFYFSDRNLAMDAFFSGQIATSTDG